MTTPTKISTANVAGDERGRILKMINFMIFSETITAEQIQILRKLHNNILDTAE